MRWVGVELTEHERPMLQQDGFPVNEAFFPGTYRNHS